MVVQPLDVKKYPFRRCENCEILLGHEVSCRNAISALIYLANCTCPDIVILYQFVSQIQFHSNSKTLK